MQPLSRSRLRSGQPRSPFRQVAVLSAAAAIITGLATFVLHRSDMAATEGSDQDEPIVSPMDVADRADGTASEQLPEFAAPAITPPRELIKIVLNPPFEIIDARTFAADEVRVEVLGIDVPGANDVCLNDSAKPWACGLRARAILSNLLRDAVVSCEGMRIPEQEVISSVCKNGDQDLALALIDAGVALPRERPPEALRARAMVAAEKAKRGLWDGAWTIRPRD